MKLFNCLARFGIELTFGLHNAIYELVKAIDSSTHSPLFKDKVRRGTEALISFSKMNPYSFSTLTTKKSLDCIATSRKHSIDFGGTLEDLDVMKLCGCSRNSYCKYKKEVKSN